MITVRRWLPVLSAGLLVGCGAHAARPVVTPKPVALPIEKFADTGAPEVTLAPDPVAQLIESAESEFSAGEADGQAGRLVAAREHFDRAVDLLLGAPGGARKDSRLASALDRLVDRVCALDVLALREGDGFTEARSEPAVIDDLLGPRVDRPQPLPATEITVTADLARTAHDVPMTVNSKVLSYIELFQGNLKDFMTEGLTRGMQYLPMIEDVFRSEGVPLDLAYVPLVESAFKPTALSRASAKGLWQFIVGTAHENGLERTWFVDDRSDPEKATHAAAQYLKSLADMFDGDWNLALASYNAGPGRIQRAIKLSKTTDFWKMSASTKFLPRETREYVPMILAAIIIARNPDRYGFDIGPAAPVAFEKVTVPDALDLKYIAEWADVSVSQIQALNPELRRTTTPSNAHALKVPMGTAAAIEAKLAEADPSLFSTFKFHTVKRGETVATIARDFKVTTADLRQANELTARARVQIGQALRIPERRANALPSRPAAATTTASNTTSATPPPPAPAMPATYRVRSGDTLSSIARKFDTTITELKTLNQLSTDVIVVGEKLTIKK